MSRRTAFFPSYRPGEIATVAVGLLSGLITGATLAFLLLHLV